ncbi:MAG: dihydropteroate synthase, partial [Victivallales bacterium]|nr:dihydropteroate synthase [Victivallales bacterium]
LQDVLAKTASGGVYLTTIQKFADEQTDAGAALLDVNCGVSGIDEAAVMRKVVAKLIGGSTLPLCIDTTKPSVAEAALRLYPGRALFNSISGEEARLREVLPIAAKYGAMLVVRSLKDDGIPMTVEGRAAVVHEIASEAAKYGYRREDMVVDGLVMTVSANPEAAEITLQTIEWATRELGTGTICGLSNISFGLPRRDLVNRAFLGMAIGRGLSMAIANPSNADIMDMVHATNVLRRHDPNAEAFIARYKDTKPAGIGSVTVTSAAENSASAGIQTPAEAALAAVIHGKEEILLQELDKCLADGMTPAQIVDNILIAGIMKVGEKYEKKEFFLPQLMSGAAAMKAGMAKMEPLVAESAGNKEPVGKIIMATVHHDIHDIGKNIVCTMLRNYNFQVIDLGKDVPPERIIEAVEKEGTTVIGLSALMTTTMTEMKKVVELAHQRGLDNLQFIVGGAVLDEEYAKSIGAHYAKDAMETVRIAQKLLGK